MTQEALKLALEALETYHEYMEPLLTVFGGPRVPAEQSTTWKVEQAITIIKDVLAQHDSVQAKPEPEQEPVTYSGNGTAGREADVRPTGFFFQMPKPEQEQEPVAHCEAGPEYCPVCNTELNQEPAIYPEEAYEMGLEEIAFYTTPPQRTWVGLTDEERNVINLQNVYTYDMALAIEAKLREKNT